MLLSALLVGDLMDERALHNLWNHIKRSASKETGWGDVLYGKLTRGGLRLHTNG